MTNATWAAQRTALLRLALALRPEPPANEVRAIDRVVRTTHPALVAAGTLPWRLIDAELRACRN